MKRTIINVSKFLLLLVIPFVLLGKTREVILTVPNKTEQFVQGNFINENGTMSTYIHDTPTQGADFVNGREALSETLGLWMEYTVLIENEALFAEAFDILQTYFLEEGGFIYWKLLENGGSEVSTNALVDDLRIVRALLEADVLWGNRSYHRTAADISDYLTKHSIREGRWTDFYDKRYDQISEQLTLSYVEPEALTQMHGRNLLPDNVYQRTMETLTEISDDEVFFPKTYHTKQKVYTFEEEINMIDQALIALNLAKADVPTEQFHTFLWQEIDENNGIYGKYERKSKRRAVDYESSAVYGFLILYGFEIGDTELINRLYSSMKRMQIQDGNYKGAYAFSEGNAHIFDQLVPLLAETTMIQEGLLPMFDG